MGEGNRTHIGHRIRAARERLGWSRETLGSRSGVSWGAIAQMESGRRRNTRSDTLLALARALGVTIEYLVGVGADLPRMFGHQAFSYKTDEEFVDMAERFIDEGLEHSEPVLVAANRENLELIRERLGPRAEQIELADSSPFYEDAPEALSLFRSFVERAVTAGASWARILAEPPWRGRNDEEKRVLMVVESLLDLTFSPLPVTMLCPYDERLVDQKVIEEAKLIHPHIRRGEEIVENDTYRNSAEIALDAPRERE